MVDVEPALEFDKLGGRPKEATVCHTVLDDGEDGRLVVARTLDLDQIFCDYDRLPLSPGSNPRHVSLVSDPAATWNPPNGRHPLGALVSNNLAEPLGLRVENLGNVCGLIKPNNLRRHLRGCKLDTLDGRI